jgi:hypothetical protein
MLFYKVLKSIVLSQWAVPVMRALAPVRISTGEAKHGGSGIGFKGRKERHKGIRFCGERLGYEVNCARYADELPHADIIEHDRKRKTKTKYEIPRHREPIPEMNSNLWLATIYMNRPPGSSSGENKKGA